MCRILPRSVCYFVARCAADCSSARSPKDMRAVRANLSIVMGTDAVDPEQVREVFRQFAMYLVDFFRFSWWTPERARRWIRPADIDFVQQALEKGNGVIALTAHLGNYELGGAVLAMRGISVSAAVLTHHNPRVDRFFKRQRERARVQGIPIQEIGRKAFLEACLASLKRNGLLALVGDRDFFGHGIELPFFGKPTRIPTGPAWFSLRTGAPIVPSFLVREGDGHFRFVLEPPIYPPVHLTRDEAIVEITKACVAAMERVIRRYPTQWYMFQPFWEPVTGVIL